MSCLPDESLFSRFDCSNLFLMLASKAFLSFSALVKRFTVAPIPSLNKKKGRVFLFIWGLITKWLYSNFDFSITFPGVILMPFEIVQHSVAQRNTWSVRGAIWKPHQQLPVDKRPWSMVFSAENWEQRSQSFKLYFSHASPGRPGREKCTEINLEFSAVETVMILRSGFRLLSNLKKDSISPSREASRLGGRKRLRPCSFHSDATFFDAI